MQNNNHFFTTLLVIAFALLFGGNAQAQTNGIVQIDSIDYQIDDTLSECTVFNIPNSLKKVIIPQKISYNGREYTVTKIGEEAVNKNNSYGIGWFQYVKLPNTIRVIEKGAFERCEIKRINIPQSVKSIGNQAFNDNLCPELVYLDIDSDCNLNSNVAITPKAVFCSANKKANYEKMNMAYDLIHVNVNKICPLNSIDDFWNLTEEKELTKDNLVGTWKNVEWEEGGYPVKTSYFFTVKLYNSGGTDIIWKSKEVPCTNDYFYKEVNCKRTWSGSWILGDNNSVKCVINKATLKNTVSYVPTEETGLREKYNPQLKAEHKRQANGMFNYSPDMIKLFNDIQYLGKGVVIDKDGVWLRVKETTATKTTTAKKTTVKRTPAKRK